MEMDLRRVTVEMQVLDPNVIEFVHPGSAEEQHPYYEPVFAVSLTQHSGQFWILLASPLHSG
jgi:hypothetical protein